VKALFDTNILIDFLNGEPAARTEVELYEDPAISIVTWIEVMVGADEASAPDIRAFLANFEIIALDEAVAEVAAQMRRRHHLKLPDAVVWASADRHGRLLVTRDVKDFPAGDPGIRAPYRLEH